MKGDGGYAELTFVGDVLTEMKIDPRAARFLQQLILTGGEADWSWTPPSAVQISMGQWEALKAMICDLIQLELVKEREYCAHALQTKPDRITLVITERGRNVMAAHAQMKIKASAIQAVDPMRT